MVGAVCFWAVSVPGCTLRRRGRRRRRKKLGVMGFPFLELYPHPLRMDQDLIALYRRRPPLIFQG